MTLFALNAQTEGEKEGMTAVCLQGLDTTRPAAPGARARPDRRKRGWQWWVSRWSLPLYRLRLGWVLGRADVITRAAR